MRIKSVTMNDGWVRALDAARITAGKEPTGKEPSDAWKVKMLRAEHSPIRLVEFDIVWEDMPYYVANHLVRHHVGCEKFVSTQRDDRTENAVPRAEKPQDAPVTMMMSVNAQALMNISAKRLCGSAAPETREAWRMAVAGVRRQDPVTASYCVRQCVRLGFCPEERCCGYYGSGAYEAARYNFQK